MGGGIKHEGAKSAATTDDDRIAALEARIVQLESRMSVLASRIDE